MTYRKSKTHSINGKSIIVKIFICLCLAICTFITYESITIYQAKKDVAEQIALAFDTSIQAQTKVQIAMDMVTLLQDSANEANEKAILAQIKAQTAMELALRSQEESQHAIELATQSQAKVENAPEEDAKKDALVQVQLTTNNSVVSQEQAKAAMDAASSAQHYAELAVEAATNADSEVQSVAQEAENINESATQAVNAITLAQVNFDTLDDVRSFSEARSILKTVEEYTNSSIVQTDDVLDSLVNLECQIKNSSQFVEKSEDMSNSVSGEIIKVDLTTQASAQAVNKTEIASQAIVNLVAKAESQARAKQIKTSSGSGLTKSKGVVYFNGHRETWYSERVLPGTGLKIPGRHTDGAGIVRDGDGYICVASMDYPKGTVIETSLGTGKVYDVCGISGTIDIYTNW